MTPKSELRAELNKAQKKIKLLNKGFVEATNRNTQMALKQRELELKIERITEENRNLNMSWMESIADMNKREAKIKCMESDINGLEIESRCHKAAADRLKQSQKAIKE